MINGFSQNQTYNHAAKNITRVEEQITYNFLTIQNICDTSITSNVPQFWSIILYIDSSILESSYRTTISKLNIESKSIDTNIPIGTFRPLSTREALALYNLLSRVTKKVAVANHQTNPELQESVTILKLLSNIVFRTSSLITYSMLLMINSVKLPNFESILSSKLSIWSFSSSICPASWSISPCCLVSFSE